MIDEAAALKKVHDLAKEQGWLDKIVDLTKKNHKILVLGSSGVGKTNLLQSLTTLVPEVIHYSTRTSDSTQSRIKIDDVPFIMIDTPGQAEHIARRSKTLREHMNSLSAVINVVCFGYHEYSRGKNQAFSEDGQVSQHYLEANKAREIEALGEWSEILGGSAPYRLITVVTKADLWWDNQEEVMEHYERGAYFENLGACSSLSPMVIHHSSVFHKLYGIGPMSGSFDESDRTLARANLLKTLVEVVGKGGIGGR